MNIAHQVLGSFTTWKENSLGKHLSNYFSKLLRHSAVDSKSKRITHYNKHVSKRNLGLIDAISLPDDQQLIHNDVILLNKVDL